MSCKRKLTNRVSWQADLPIARLHVIFELLVELGRLAHPLAYIEWFTLFQQCDRDMNTYPVLHSSCNRGPNVEIVSRDRIIGIRHVASKYGVEVSNELTSENAWDVAAAFTVLTYLNLHTFTT